MGYLVLATEHTTVFMPGAGPPPHRMMIASFIRMCVFDLVSICFTFPAVKSAARQASSAQQTNLVKNRVISSYHLMKIVSRTSTSVIKLSPPSERVFFVAGKASFRRIFLNFVKICPFRAGHVVPDTVM